MTELDLPLVLLIENQEYPFPWTEGIFRDCLNHRHYHGFLISLDQQVIGYAIISIAAQECQILNICVDSAFQNKGYGKKILHHIIDLAKSHGVDQIFLEVRKSNHRAINLYDSCGFNELGIRKNYYPHHSGREDACLYAMQL